MLSWVEHKKFYNSGPEVGHGQRFLKYTTRTSLDIITDTEIYYQNGASSQILKRNTRTGHHHRLINIFIHVIHEPDMN